MGKRDTGKQVKAGTQVKYFVSSLSTGGVESLPLGSRLRNNEHFFQSTNRITSR